jgi:hypothetical protein
MSIVEQKKLADEFAILQQIEIEISDSIKAVSAEIFTLIAKVEENICTEIKTKVLNEGEANGLKIVGKEPTSKTWGMKYNELEYNCDFTSDVKTIDRRNGRESLKIQFILVNTKRKPNRNISLTGPFKNQCEQEEKMIDAQKEILDNLEKYKREFKETDIVIQCISGDSSTHHSRESIEKGASYPIKIDALVKLILG